MNPLMPLKAYYTSDDGMMRLLSSDEANNHSQFVPLATTSKPCLARRVGERTCALRVSHASELIGMKR